MYYVHHKYHVHCTSYNVRGTVCTMYLAAISCAVSVALCHNPDDTGNILKGHLRVMMMLWWEWYWMVMIKSKKS